MDVNTARSARAPADDSPGRRPICLPASHWLTRVEPPSSPPTSEPFLARIRALELQDGGAHGLVGKRGESVYKSNYVEFNVFEACYLGNCACIFKVNNVPVQLKPCRALCECFLHGYTDPDWEWIIYNSCFGARVIDTNCELQYSSDNYIKSGKDYDIVNDQLKKELEQGFISVVSYPMYCIHPIGGVPKDDGSIRKIIDCSSPKLDNVNNYVNTISERFSFKSVDDVADNIGPKAYSCTIDIKDAFRALHIHPDSAKFQGLAWDFGEGKVYLRDNRLSMGLSSSPYTFNRTSDFIVRCLERAGYKNCVNYLDDFCVWEDSRDRCAESQRALMHILRRLGFYVSYKKCTPPSTCTTFLGIIIDTVEREIRLPVSKLTRVKELVKSFAKARYSTKERIDELAGLLAHCSKVVRGGRTFCRRIYDLSSSVRNRYARLTLSEAFREDIRWWRDFMPKFNGKAKLYDYTGPVVSMYSDASYYGYGAYHAGDWLAASYEEKEKSPILEAAVGHRVTPPKQHVVDNINVLELIPILDGVKRWAAGWRNRRVCAITDNTQVMYAVRTGRSKNKNTMTMLRELFWLSAEFNFYMDIVYINTKVNKVCDSLSRLNEPEAVKTLQETMSPKSLCCHHLFHRDGGTKEGGGRHHKASLRPGERGNKSVPAEEIHALLRGLRPGPHPMHKRQGSAICSLHGPDHESLVNQGLPIGPEPLSKSGGNGPDKLCQLPRPHGPGGHKAEVGYGGEEGVALAAPTPKSHACHVKCKHGPRRVPRLHPDVIPRPAAEAERNRVRGEPPPGRRHDDGMGNDVKHQTLEDDPARRPHTADPSSQAEGAGALCSLLGGAALPGGTRDPSLSSVPGGPGNATHLRLLLGHVKLCRG